ncbi:MAG: hypothetical protein ACRDSR_11135 [Pseudonocardiaceae bacterium]
MTGRHRATWQRRPFVARRPRTVRVVDVADEVEHLVLDVEMERARRRGPTREALCGARIELACLVTPPKRECRACRAPIPTQRTRSD